MAVKPQAITEQTLTESELVNQVKRLRGYRGFIELADELQRVLKREAKSYDHADRILTYVIDTRKPAEIGGYVGCPTPAEFADLCREVPAVPASIQPADSRCAHCRGTGFEIITRGRISGARECRCRRPGADESIRRSAEMTNRMLGEKPE